MAWVSASTIATVAGAPPETSSGWSHRGEGLARSSAAAASSFDIQYDVVAPDLVKLTTQEQTQNEILDHCVRVQTPGGYGYMNEYRAARAWKDACVTKIWAETNEIMK